ncbi:MAG: hypothetical protein JOY71_02340 [Acetobacteraceae bacterium]|nr:hypothetical protein [Acetobacteraceae bacterium]
MSKPSKVQKEPSPPPAEPRQMSIAFESNRLRGLTAAERTKTLMDLAYLLMLAAGLVVEENDDER